MTKVQKVLCFIFMFCIFYEALAKDKLPEFVLFLVMLALLTLPNWFYLTWRDKKQNKPTIKNRKRKS